MTDTMPDYTPAPGSARDAVAQAAQHEAAPEHAKPTAAEASFVVNTRSDMPEETIPRTLVLGSANPYLMVLPRDMQRRRAVLLAIDSDVIITESQELAQNVATQVAAGVSGAPAPFNQTVTFTAGQAKTLYLAAGDSMTGFDVSISPATSAGLATISVAAAVGLSYVVEESTTASTFLSRTFPAPIPYPGYDITLSIAALTNGGSGVLNAYGISPAGATPSGGFYLRAGVPLPLESRDVMFAVATSTAAASRISVVVERYAAALGG